MLRLLAASDESDYVPRSDLKAPQFFPVVSPLHELHVHARLTSVVEPVRGWELKQSVPGGLAVRPRKALFTAQYAAKMRSAQGLSVQIVCPNCDFSDRIAGSTEASKETDPIGAPFVRAGN